LDKTIGEIQKNALEKVVVTLGEYKGRYSQMLCMENQAATLIFSTPLTNLIPSMTSANLLG
jgi:hypothetical protein